ncbi:MAG: hypothetical protein Q8M11_21270 [Sulfuritalea sp.]|nr:hypothetical protein [Sulfuritalea sp.]MDP1984656.1 hypothetical protein [Sulfuritalea sp.]
MGQKALTVRLPDALFNELEKHAEQQKTTMADAVRGAVAASVSGASLADLAAGQAAIAAAVTRLDARLDGLVAETA